MREAYVKNTKTGDTGSRITRRMVLGGIGAACAADTFSNILPTAPSAAPTKPEGAGAVPMRLYGHRGALIHAPENTLPALELCLITGCGFEIDFFELRDGEIIALHDGNFNRTTDTQIPNDLPRQRDLAYVKQLDAGAWFHADFAGTRIPTLPEVCDLVRRRALVDGVVMLLDVKILTKNFLERVKAEFEKPGELFTRSLFRVDTVAQAQIVKACDKRFTCVKSGNERNVTQDVLEQPQVFDGVWTGNMAAATEMLKVGKTCYMTLFNRPEQAIRLRDMGATGVITNYPTELKRVAYPPPAERDWDNYMKSDATKDGYRFNGKI